MLPCPINKQDLCIPGASNKSYLSLFLHGTNGDTSNIDEPRGINYYCCFQGGSLWTWFPLCWRKRQAFLKTQNEISCESPVAHESAIIAKLRCGLAKNYKCPKGWQLSQVFFNYFMLLLLKQYSESHPMRLQTNKKKPNKKENLNPTNKNNKIIPLKY